MMESGRRKVLLTLAVLTLGIAELGMGGLGSTGRQPGVPEPEFRATFVDRDGIRVEARRVTAGGSVSLEGQVGRGRLRIPFDNIARIEFSGAGHQFVHAKVELRKGKPVTVRVRSSTTFYGQTPSGAYRIHARDLKAVEFAPR